MTSLGLAAAAMAIDITGIKPPTQMFFGIVTAVLGFELYVYQRLDSKLDSKE